MNKYQDKYSAYHDKITGSNNPAIYTAYADVFKLPIDHFGIHELFELCSDTTDGYWRVGRTPSNIEKSSSRDEIIGWFHLGKIPYSQLVRHNFRYEYQWIKFRPFRAFNAMVKLIGKDRNYHWENNLYDAYPITFRLPPQDIHYVKVVEGEKVSLISHIFFFLYFISVIIKSNKNHGDVSAKNILWLQLHDMKSKYLIRFVDHKKNLSDYFEVDHPITKAVQ